ncbi:MAG: hypothetical protein JWP09_857 [Candidatus Taylorbacteria bacterium]|nr:hypothetical protein [Candidatus Taylorbacteria bacterium]
MIRSFRPLLDFAVAHVDAPQFFADWLVRHFSAIITTPWNGRYVTVHIPGVQTYKLKSVPIIGRPPEEYVAIRTDVPISQRLLQELEAAHAVVIGGEDHWRLLDVKTELGNSIGCIHIAYRANGQPLGTPVL